MDFPSHGLVLAHHCLWPFFSPSLLYMVCGMCLKTVIVLPQSYPVLFYFVAVFW